MTAKEEVVYFPLSTIERSCGFSFDIGGSMAKVIYRPKDLYRNGKLIHKKEGETRGPLYLRVMDKNDVAGLVELLKVKCDMTLTPVVNVTGFGCNVHKTTLETGLNVKLNVLSEFDCTGIGFHYLYNVLPKEELVFSKSTNAVAAGVAQGSKYQQWDRNNEKYGEAFHPRCRTEPEPEDTESKGRWENEPHFPVMVVLTGSNCAYMKVYENGEFELNDVTQIGGKFFLGMCALVSNETDFEKLYGSIVSGDGGHVDLYTDDMKDPDTSDDTYADMPSGLRIFPLGKINPKNKDNFSEGDLACSLLRTVCVSLAQFTQLTAYMEDVKRAYFCGNLTNLPLAQEYITTEFTSRNKLLAHRKRVDFQFVKLGGYVGAVGALFKGI